MATTCVRDYPTMLKQPLCIALPCRTCRPLGGPRPPLLPSDSVAAPRSCWSDDPPRELRGPVSTCNRSRTWSVTYDSSAAISHLAYTRENGLRLQYGCAPYSATYSLGTSMPGGLYAAVYRSSHVHAMQTPCSTCHLAS